MLTKRKSGLINRKISWTNNSGASRNVIAPTAAGLHPAHMPLQRFEWPACQKTLSSSRRKPHNRIAWRGNEEQRRPNPVACNADESVGDCPDGHCGGEDPRGSVPRGLPLMAACQVSRRWARAQVVRK